MTQPTNRSSTNQGHGSSGASSIERIPQDQIPGRLAEVAGWTYQRQKGGAIAKDFCFHDFAGAFGFMTQVALRAESLNHHPEWTNVYSRVSVRLTTHDVGGLSDRDFELARWMDSVRGCGLDA